MPPKISTRNPCQTCAVEVKKTDACFQCEICEEWTHSKCLNIEKTIFDTLSKLKTFKYICDSCDPKFNSLVKMEKRIDTIEAKFTEFVSMIEAKIASLSENPEPPFPANANFVGGTMPRFRPGALPPLPYPSVNNKDFVQSIESVIEAASKKKNAVLFGLAETDEEDLTAVRKLLKTGPGDDKDVNSPKICPTDIQNVFRDGPFYNDKPRFLKIVCATSKVKDDFIKYINKFLKQSDPEFSDLRSRPDLTYVQRMDGKALRAKFSDLDPNNHYIDYNRKIIVSKLTRQIVFTLNNA